MSRRNAAALDTLVASIKATHPRTTIGTYRAGNSDVSDHHPWLKDSNGIGVVRAADVMGTKLDKLAGNLASQLGRHPALGAGAYVIWSRRIISTDRLGEGWRKYNGASPHTDHVHVSLTRSQAGFDSPRAWGPLMTATGAQITGDGLTSTRPGQSPAPTAVAAGLTDSDGVVGSIVALVVQGTVLLGAVALVGIGVARITRRDDSRGDDTPTVNVTTTPRGTTP